MTADAVPLLELDAVGVRFGGVRALDEVSLSVEPGEVVGIIGPNGAGKSTLFDVISGLRKPTAGRVRFRGTDVTRRSAPQRARAGIRRTFQRQQLFDDLSVLDNVVAGQDWRGGGGGPVGDVVAWPARRRPERSRREQARRTLELCGFDRDVALPAGTLAIGAARTVEFARAVVDGADLLLLDEPTSGLGKAETRRFGETLDAVHAEQGFSVLLVEHDVGFVMEHASRILVLHLGRVLAAGTPAEVRADPEVRAAYLG